MCPAPVSCFAVRFIAYPREGRVEEFVEDVGFEPLVAVR